MSRFAKAILLTSLLFTSIILFFSRRTLIEKYNEVFKTEVYQKEDAAKITEVKKKKKSGSNSIGTIMDEFEGVPVYINGKVLDVHGRHITKDGYNLGLKYQCVEFVKRYYFEKYGHRMPDSYGDAKDYFNHEIQDGKLNAKRGLIQCKNKGIYKPKNRDILVFGPNVYNKFGHVAIVTAVSDSTVSCISQNLGSGNGSRRSYILQNENGAYYIDDADILGWLRKE